jgi:hypothetical protein
MQLFLDCSGVLADHEAGAAELLGVPAREFAKNFGLEEFWRRIADHPNFYGALPLKPDARELFEAVRHLDPIILTGCPRGNWAGPQKVKWAAQHFPGTRIITCLAVDKSRHAQEGDVLVDDMLRYRHLWERVGGVFVHHRSAAATMAELLNVAPEAFPPSRASGPRSQSAA